MVAKKRPHSRRRRYYKSVGRVSEFSVTSQIQFSQNNLPRVSIFIFLKIYTSGQGINIFKKEFEMIVTMLVLINLKLIHNCLTILTN
jgi:hypothetical protein